MFYIPEFWGDKLHVLFEYIFAPIVYNDSSSLFGGFMFGLIALLSIAQAEEISTSDVFVPDTEEQANNGNKKQGGNKKEDVVNANKNVPYPFV